MAEVKRSVLVASALLLLGLAIVLFPPTLHLVPTVGGSNRAIALIGNYLGWNYSLSSGTNPPITVTQGDTVVIKLTSVDYTHQFALDLDRDGPVFMGLCPSGDNCSGRFDPTTPTPTSISIPVSFTPGTYKYFCTFHSTMVGDFIVQGFTTASNPSSLAIVQGSSGTSTMSLNSVNGFSGSVSLSYSAPSGITASFSPMSVPLTSGGTGTSQATISVASTVSTGSYTVTLTGTSGSAMQSTTVAVTVTAPGSPDFTVTANPTSSTVDVRVAGNSTITIASLNGFTGTVDLATATNSTQLACALTSTSIPGGPGTSILSCSSSTAANYLATVTGTSGMLSHMATVVYHVQDFSVSANPTSVSVTQGSTGITTITFTSLNGFSGTLSLTGIVSPSGPSVSFSPASITVSSGGSGMSTVTVSAVGGLYSSVAVGNYSINVTATNGSLSHSTTIQVTVGSSNSSPSGALGLPLTVWAGVAVVIIGVVAVTVFLVKRKTAK